MTEHIDDLLEPISEDRPCGEDLSFSLDFDRIQEARREDDPSVDYGEWQTTLKQADWAGVIGYCRELLQLRCKDLRVAAWLAEAWTKTRGLSGLADGVELSARLLERFGQLIHPEADDGDQERRVGTLNWLMMRMSHLVQQIPLTRSKSGQYSLMDYEAALQLQAQVQRGADAVAELEDKITLEKISDAALKTEKSLYRQWISDAERCNTSLQRLILASDLQFGIDGPSFAQLKNGIETVRRRLELIGNEIGVLASSEISSNTETQGQTEEWAISSEHIPGPIRSRGQALETLRQVAEFFRKTEPHSPVAYLANKAAQWGNMPLHVWLRSVLKDQGALSHIEELLGLEMDENSSRSD